MFNDPSINTAITLILEKSINTALRYDPATALKLSLMGECCIKIACESPSIDLYFQTQNAQPRETETLVTEPLETETLEAETTEQRIPEQQIRVLSYYEKEADMMISGKASDFLAMMGGSKHSLADSNISVSGKINLLNQLKSILADLDIDWEEALTDILGVIPGHAVAEGLRSSFEFLTRQGNAFKDNLPHYLSEELRAIPSQPELDSFYHEVDELKSASTRLEARLQRLLQQHSTQQHPTKDKH